MGTSPNKRSATYSGVNPLLSNFSGMSLEQAGNQRSRHSSNTSPLKGSRSSGNLRCNNIAGQTTNTSRPTIGRPMSRDDIMGRDLVRKDWGVKTSPTKKSSSSSSRKPTVGGDRYIAREVDPCALDAHSRDNPHTSTSGETNRTTELSTALGIDLNRRILTFSAEVPSSSRVSREREDPIAKERTKASSGGLSNQSSTNHRRQVSNIPERVLDAPGLIDDYYLNLTDWSVDNILAIALGECLYLWNAQTGNVSLLCSLDENSYFASVKFSADGHYLALGTSEGAVHIYDIDEARLLRKMLGRECRVATLSWSGTTLSAGGLDGSIWNHDVQAARHKASEMIGHQAEVCGLAWRPDVDDLLASNAQGLLASGANDNVVNVWDARNVNEPRMTKSNHRAAVKAIAWCPWQSNLLATGGGTSDKMVHFWNVNTSSRLQSLETRSQVTSIVFNPYAREFLTTHGLPDMHFSIHTFPHLQLVADIPKAHDTRILHSALSPDGCIVVTASSDENLKFWRVFENKRVKVPASAVFGKAYPLAAKDQNQQDFKGGYAVR
ncbi:WD40-repeat-containing domain protein [Phakopsora pachyrhizi]|uniref:WD40-repeat-containing domain protein n=1 Tax=Phakopsora pachyrhizi TaxID=170000 RepID=A0AAV0B639_PHAPC|nr:WD40-repeat-containing domain protein [Phakopsora pachyrhizi]CAH7681165.1 WD40-repeat-containing domain protein [Phakopsora pachyrhizi]